MGAPTTWSSPSSGGGATLNGSGRIAYLGGYWIAVSYSTTSGDIRTATDPTGTWTSRHTITPPTGYSMAGLGPIAYDGTTWAVTVLYYDPGASPGNLGWYSHIVYATNPTSSWSSTTVDTSSVRYSPFCARYLSGQWVFGGSYIDMGGDYSHAFLATASSITGTWTYDTTDAGTGTTGQTGNNAAYTTDVVRFGSTYINNWGTTASLQSVPYSSSLSGTWTANTSGRGGYDRGLRVTGSHVISRGNDIAYSSDADTYTTISLSDAGFSELTADAIYNGEYWLLTGSNNYGNIRVSYLLSTSPAGTYTVVNPGFSASLYPADVDHDGTYFVVMASNGSIRYSESPSPVVSTARALLRRRQSPAWAPSRVRPTDLRQRQTPYIT